MTSAVQLEVGDSSTNECKVKSFSVYSLYIAGAVILGRDPSRAFPRALVMPDCAGAHRLYCTY